MRRPSQPLQPEPPSKTPCSSAPPYLPLCTVLGVPVTLVCLADAADVILELARLLVPARAPGAKHAHRSATGPTTVANRSAGHTRTWPILALSPLSAYNQATFQPAPLPPSHFSLSLSVFQVELAARKTYLRGWGYSGVGWGLDVCTTAGQPARWHAPLAALRQRACPGHIRGKP